MSRYIFIQIILTSFLFLSACSRGNESGLNPGDTPPVIELTDLDGKPFDFNTTKGQVVLLNFWASWCGPCVAELPSLELLYESLKDKGFTVIAIGVEDTAESLREFQKKYSLTFPLLIDKTGSVKSRYRVSGVPESFIIGKDGKLVLVADPEGNTPVVRIIGPRLWNSPVAILRMKELLSD